MAMIRAIDDTERRFLSILAAVALVVALVGGIWLATSLGKLETRLSADFWKQVLTTLGLSTLALAGVAVQIPRYSGGGTWAKIAIVTVSLAFIFILVILTTSLREMAVPPGTAGTTGFGSILIGCLGMSLTLGAVVISGAATVLDKIDVPAAAR